jgi:hypothetical protein
MSRFEINPNTLEPYVQEPLRRSDQFSAKRVAAPSANSHQPSVQDSEPTKVTTKWLPPFPDGAPSSSASGDS